MTFGHHIRALRKARGLRLQDVAVAVSDRLNTTGWRGFTVSYLSKIENNRVLPPSISIIVHLSSILDADGDDLLALAGKTPPDLDQLLIGSTGARTFFRQAQRLDLTDDEWRELAHRLPERIPIVTPLREIDAQTVAVELRGVTWTVRHAPDAHGWPFYAITAARNGKQASGRALHYKDPCHNLEFPNPPRWLADALPDDGVEGMFFDEDDGTELMCLVLPHDVRMQIRHWMEARNAEGRAARARDCAPICP